MEFRNAVERWHKFGEFAEELKKFAEHKEIQEIHKCAWYEWDNQSCEEYCSHPKIVDDDIAMFKPIVSREECWKCPHWEIITGVPA